MDVRRLLARAAAWRGAEVRDVELRLPRWPAGLDGLRATLFSDLHAGAPQITLEAVADVVARVNATAADLVLFAGDLADDHHVAGDRLAAEPLARALGELRAPLGVRAVLGNHDRLYGAPELATALRRHGVDVLQDEARELEHHGTRFWLAGAGGTYREARDARPALARVPPGDPVLLLAHEPDLFPTVPDTVALTVAGHTHGGQVAIPRLRSRWTPSRFGERYARGLVVEGGRHLFVSSGVGTSRLPVRLGAPPEVVVLTLRSASVAA